MEGVTADQIMDAVVVVLAVLSALAIFDKSLDIIKKWRAPSREMEKKLANDKNRLDNHETAISELKRSNQVICAGVMALLDHELHNGNASQMEEARDNLMDYLQLQITR